MKELTRIQKCKPHLKVVNFLVAAQAIPIMSYNAKVEFKKELRANGSWFCNAYCWANFMLTLAVIFSILDIIWFSFAVKVMDSPYDTYVFEGNDVTGGEDWRILLEDAGYTKSGAITMLILETIGFILNVMGYFGRHQWYGMSLRFQTISPFLSL